MSFMTNSFLLAVERAELDRVKYLLETRYTTGLDINCRDPLERNALIICIDNKNLDVVQLLLKSPDVQVGDALLYAIQENYVEAVELLVDYWISVHGHHGHHGHHHHHHHHDHRRHDQQQQQQRHHHHQHGVNQITEEYCFFSDDMTPLMLAAQRNNLEIVKLLLDRQVSPLPDPHDPRCGCASCGQARVQDCLKHSRARINAYRALSAPIMMALSSPDPLKTAFELSAKLEHLAQLEPEYKEDYMRMRAQCQAFATKLLDYTRTSKELESLLDFGGHDESSSSSCSVSFEDDEVGGRHEFTSLQTHDAGQLDQKQGTKFVTTSQKAQRRTRQPTRLARLKLAIECKQKTFCAHPNIQELLATMWYENLPGFRRMSMFEQTLQVLCIGLLFPFYSLAYLVAPKSQLGLYIKKPFIKFICHSASYITFITLLVLASQRVEAFYSWSSVMGLFVANVNEAAGAAGNATLSISGTVQTPEGNFSLFHRTETITGGGGGSNASSAVNLDDLTSRLSNQQQMELLYRQATTGGGHEHHHHHLHSSDEFGARGLDSLRKIFEEFPASSKKRGTLPSPIESIILIWVLSLIWAELKQIRALGMNYYKHDMWNLLDSVASGCYIGTLVLRIISYVQCRRDEHSMEEPREQWHAYDPTLLSEGLFATATIFSSLKLVYIFSVNPYLGPLQISLGRMIIDILRFSWIYMLVLFAFACGMNQLLWYYADLERHHLQREANINHLTGGGGGGGGGGGDDLDQFYKAKHFSNVFESSQTLFWANFGLVDLENFDLTGIRQYTRFWALLMFGCYCFINVIVVLNLLIAMMNHSYVKISTRSDIEWKFARTRLWMSYFENGSTVPAPFNVIPSIKSIRYALERLLRHLISWFARRPRALRNSSGIMEVSQHHEEHAKDIKLAPQHHQSNDSTPVTYERVIKALVRRYLVDQQRQVEKKSRLTEAKLERWLRLNVFAAD